MSNDKAPCYECPDRYLGCHANCPKYLHFRAERDKVLEIRHQRIELERNSRELVMSGMRRMSRGRVKIGEKN